MAILAFRATLKADHFLLLLLVTQPVRVSGTTCAGVQPNPDLDNTFKHCGRSPQIVIWAMPIE